MSTNEDEKVDENVNIEISFIGEGGGRAILRFHRNDLTKTTIWRDAKIRVRRRTSTRGTSPFQYERQHSPGSLWNMFQGLIRPKNARSDPSSFSTSRRLFADDTIPPIMSLPPPRNSVEDETTRSHQRTMSNSSTESDLSSIATRKSEDSARATATPRNVDGLFYFEALVVSASSSSSIAIGIAEMDVETTSMSSFSLSSVTRELPGKRADSWAYHKDGNVYPGGKKYGPTYGEGDVIGCGWDWRHRIVFFTKNGTRYPSAFSNLVPRHDKAYFPTIGVKNSDDVVVIAPNVYGARPFICQTTHFVAGRRPPPPPPPRLGNRDLDDEDSVEETTPLFKALTALNRELEKTSREVEDLFEGNLGKILNQCTELRLEEMRRITDLTTRIENFHVYENIEQCTFCDEEMSDLVFRKIHHSEDVLRSSYRAHLRLHSHMECLRTCGIALPPIDTTESLISTADNVVRARVQSVSTQSKSSKLMVAAFWPFPISARPQKESMNIDMLTYLMRSGGLQLRYESAQRILQLSLRERDVLKQLELMNGTLRGLLNLFVETKAIPVLRDMTARAIMTLVAAVNLKELLQDRVVFEGALDGVIQVLQYLRFRPEYCNDAYMISLATQRVACYMYHVEPSNEKKTSMHTTSSIAKFNKMFESVLLLLIDLCSTGKDKSSIEITTPEDQSPTPLSVSVDTLSRISKSEKYRQQLVQIGVLKVLVPLLLQRSIKGVQEDEKEDYVFVKSRDESVRLSAVTTLSYLVEQPAARSNVVSSSSSPQESYMDVYTCGWISAKIVDHDALPPLIELVSDASSQNLDVVRIAAKVLANLASFRPNRDAMLRAGAVMGIVRGLASVHSDETLILEYLMKTLSQIVESSQTNEPYAQLISPEILNQLCNLLLSGVHLDVLRIVSRITEFRPKEILGNCNILPLLAKLIERDHVETRLRAALVLANIFNAVAEKQEEKDDDNDNDDDDDDGNDDIYDGDAQQDKEKNSTRIRETRRRRKKEKSLEKPILESHLLVPLVSLISNKSVKNTEVRHQIVRAIAGLAGVCANYVTANGDITLKIQGLIRGWPFALSELTKCLESPNILVQTDAARALASLAKMTSLQDAIVSSRALDLMTSFLKQQHEDPLLRKLSDAVLVALGFKSGSFMLETCNHRVDLLRDWFFLRRGLEEQACIFDVIRREATIVWESEGPPVHSTHKNKVSESNNSSVSISDRRDVKATRKSLLKKLLLCLPPDHVVQESRQQHSQIAMIRDKFRSGSSDIFEGLDRPSMHRGDSVTDMLSSSSLSFDNHEAGYLPLHLRLRLRHYVPSALRRFILIPYPSSFPNNNGPSPRFLLLPSRSYTHNFPFGVILSAILKANETFGHEWGLAFRNSTLSKLTVPSFIRSLSQMPAIQSLSFRVDDGTTERSEAQDKVYKQILTELPPWIRWLTLDNCLLKNMTIDFLALAIRSQWVGGGGGNGLEGLALRNHEFRTDALRPVIELLRVSCEENNTTPTMTSSSQRLKRFPSSNGLRGLVYLDISGNLLGDAGAAETIGLLRHNKRLRALDLSFNYISGGAQVANALKLVMRSNTALETLRLAGNAIDGRGFSVITQALTQREYVGSMRFLDLSRNQFKPDARDIGKLISTNHTLTYLSLEGNILSEDCGMTIRLALQRNSTLCFLRLSGSTQSELREVDKIFSEKRIWHNRRLIYTKSRGDIEDWQKRQQILDGQSKEDEENMETLAPPMSVHRWPSVPLGLSLPLITPGFSLSLVQPKLEKTSSTDTINTTDGEDVPSLLTRTSSGTFGGARIVFMYSAPLAWLDKNFQLRPIDTLNFDIERQNLRQCLLNSRRDIKLVCVNATTERLRDEVTRGCTCLHYSGHGSPRHLSFEDGCGGLHVVDDKRLRSLCEAGGVQKLKFVFVSACYSQRAGQAFADAGVPHVCCVDVDEQLLDRAAQVFTHAFYLAVACGNTIRGAFEVGVSAVAVAPNIHSKEGDKFLLLPKDANHDVALFEGVPRLSSRRRRRNPTLTGAEDLGLMNLPAVPENFLGRNVEMYRLLVGLSRRRLLSVTGPRSMGKTALAIAVSHYMAQRQMFRNGVFFVRLDGMRNSEAMVRAISHAVGLKLSERHSSEKRSSNDTRLFDALKTKRCVVVLDHCDDVMHCVDFRNCLGRLLDHTRNLKLILTARVAVGSLPGFTEDDINMRRLLPGDAMNLLLKLSPDADLSLRGSNRDRALHHMQTHPVLSKLDLGWPGRCVALANNLRNSASESDGLLSLLLEDQQDEKRISEQVKRLEVLLNGEFESVASKRDGKDLDDVSEGGGPE